MRALFSVCRVKPSGIVTGAPSDALDALVAIEYNLTQPIRLSVAALRQRSARMAKARVSYVLEVETVEALAFETQVFRVIDGT